MSWVRKWIKRINFRKVLIGVGIAIVILLPTVLAISNVIYTNQMAAERSLTVVLYDEDENELYRASEGDEFSGEASLTGIFKAIQSNMERTEKPPEGISTEPPLIAELISESGTTELTCHFSFTQGGSYCIDKNEIYYRIPSEDSERFLASEYAEVLYSEATPPVLSTGEGDSVLPVSTTWNYLNIDSVFLPATKVLTESEVLTYDVTGSISLGFSATPDYCLVRIYDENNKVFEGTPSELPSLILDSSTLLRLEVRAEWNSNSGRSFYGVTNYVFNVIVHNRAEFSVSDTVLRRGEFIVLKATQIVDLSKLNFKSDKSDFSPQFTIIGDNAYAVIPYPDDITTDTYTFTVSYGVSARTFTVTADANADVASASELNASAADMGMELDIANSVEIERSFLDGIIRAPEAVSFTVGTGFGDSIKYGVNNIPAFFTEYECIGSGMTVVSASGGYVMYTGENEVMGQYAVVDLGLGLKIWYCGLSALDVSLGDYVAAGDIIGRTGKLISGSEGYSLMLTYYDSLLDVTSLW